MSIWLKCYINDPTNAAVCNTVKEAWHTCFASVLGNPDRHPRQIMQTYCDGFGISEDQLEEELDWDTWSQNSTTK